MTQPRAFQSDLPIFVLADPCATGPAGNDSGPAVSPDGSGNCITMSEKPIIGRYARIIMDHWFKRSFGTENMIFKEGETWKVREQIKAY